MNISVEIIPHNLQRYPTVGDWVFEPDGTLNINVSDTGNELYNTCIAIHEIIEAILCKHANISGEIVDNWDMTHLDLDEPGEDPECPYVEQHMIATIHERSISRRMGVDWNAYLVALQRM